MTIDKGLSAITAEFLHEAFEYRDAKLFWKVRPAHHFNTESQQRVMNKRMAGKEAGCVNGGYRNVNLKQLRLGVHRAVFLMHHGYLPATVDHINGDKQDNRIENLRAATQQENTINRKRPSSNTSGVKGVSFNKEMGKWVAYIKKSGKTTHLGSFAALSEAASRRAEAQLEVFGEFANDR